MANYYEILGVDKNATQSEIKSAYRKLVKEYHPDLHPGDEACATKFKEINEANETLSDPEKRKKYDFELEHPNMGFNGFEGFGQGGFSGFGDFFSDIFSQFSSGGEAQDTDRRGDDIQITVDLSFLDGAKGCQKEIKYKRKEACTTCRGTGAKNGTSYNTCQTCKGKGQVQYVSGGGFFRTISYRTCQDCNGLGRKIIDKCNDCGGKGYNVTTTIVNLDIPAGADTNSYMRKRGYGNASIKGGESGDLIVVFNLLPHKIFKRKNFDLYIELPISYKVAVLGGKVKIPTIDEVIEFTVPECTQSGKTFILRGKGIKTRRTTGDMYVTVVVEIPSKLSREDRKNLEKFDGGIDKKRYDKLKKFADDMSSLYGVDDYI